jgi:CheY-like chemotaxis protein
VVSLLELQNVGLAALRVLVVEDVPVVREAILQLLREGGIHDVTGAEDGADGFGSFLRTRPDVVLTDLRMPRADGFELVQRIRALCPEEGGLTPVIAMTAYADDEVLVLSAGFHALLTKPFSGAQVIELLRGFADAKVDHPGDDAGTGARWTFQASPGCLRIVYSGHVRVGDVRATAKLLLTHLERGPCHVITDIRRLTGFDWAVGSVAERRLWSVRHALLGVTVVGGTWSARLASAASCRILGAPCSLVDEMPPLAHEPPPA